MRFSPILRVVRRLTTPMKIQAYLDSIPYSHDEFYRPPAAVVRDRTAHCFDGAIFAAAALRHLGDPPMIVELLPNERDDDHLIAIFRRRAHWGAVAKSNFVGLRFREPVYRSIRELVMSYFEPYYNLAGERTLRGYTAPLDLRRFDARDWLTRLETMDAIGDSLDRVRRYPILTASMVRHLSMIDRRSYKTGLTGSNPRGLYRVNGRHH
jgi:hypothetical protein